MSQDIQILSLPLPFRMGRGNCYLIQTAIGHALIDTGSSNARKELHRELESAGCRPGTLTLIVLTHGDFGHIGNAAYLRAAFGSKIAMHADDARVAETGDMFVNRAKSNVVLRVLIPMLIGFDKSKRFTPNVVIGDGCSRSEYGLEARALWIPGHSPGSIGILTADGCLFCGDLFDSTQKLALSSLIDDHDAAIRSAAKPSALGITTVYPGHGEPFSMDQLVEDRSGTV